MRVFISYASADTEIVNLLREELEKYGIECSLTIQDLTPSVRLSKRIRDAIEESDAVIVLLTENSINSPSVSQEFAFAKAGDARIIPLVEKGIKAETFLQGLKYITFEYEKIPRMTTKILSRLLKKNKEERRI